MDVDDNDVEFTGTIFRQSLKDGETVYGFNESEKELCA